MALLDRGDCYVETCPSCRRHAEKKTMARSWRSRVLLPFQSAKNYGREFVSEYETEQTVTIKSYWLGCSFRLVQLCILTYLIGYVFIFKKSYQEFESVESSVTVKVKGLIRDENRVVWDATDFVIPTQEKDAFFISTSIIRTDNQSHGLCAEDPTISRDGVICKTNKDCKKNEAIHLGSGFRTGRCVPWNSTLKTCQVSAWCPLENDEPPTYPQLTNFETITVLIKNHVAFPRFNITTRNILPHFNNTYLSKCRYNPDDDDKYCPVFGFKDMVGLASPKKDFLDTATRGGIISIRIQWDCDLDYDLKYCLPVYSFRRLDGSDDQTARGWNFRHASHVLDPSGNDRRDLLKIYGVRFVINVEGSAGKFSPVNFALDAGSGLGLLEVASLICGLILIVSCIKPKSNVLDQPDDTHDSP